MYKFGPFFIFNIFLLERREELTDKDKWKELIKFIYEGGGGGDLISILFADCCTIIYKNVFKKIAAQLFAKMFLKNCNYVIYENN